MRTLTGRHELALHVSEGSSAQAALIKFFNYFPSIREDVFDVHWQPAERDDARGTPWFTVKRDYVVKPQWRVLHNGRDLAYYGGLQTPLHPQDEVHIFPPGR
jgi:molybdopterin converting factor small subunit